MKIVVMSKAYQTAPPSAEIIPLDTIYDQLTSRMISLASELSCGCVVIASEACNITTIESNH